MNTPTVLGFLTAFSLFSGACVDDGSTTDDSLPVLRTHADGRLAIVSPFDVLVDPIESPPTVVAAGAATQPWEPGSGFFAFDPEDPESREYYSDCAVPTGGITFDSVIQVVANPVDSTRDRFFVATAVPPEPFNYDVDGQEIFVGKRLASPVEENFAFQGSYVDCSWPEPNVIDLRPWGIDALITQNQECHEYWDYGQDRYRELAHRTTDCEGEDCDGDFVSANLGELPCSQGGMAAFTRIPSPF